MNSFAIHDYFGYDMPMNERYKLIRSAGFHSVILGWAGFPDNPDETKQKNPELARKNGLHIENMHTPFAGANEFWLDKLDGEEYLNKQLSCIEDCKRHEIPAMVLHINQGLTPPLVTSIGLKRLEHLVNKAEKYDVYLAFENMRNTEHLRYIWNNIKSDQVKFCYDSGHQNCKTPNEDLLTEYGDRLIAIHLHDNNGVNDQHILPFDGTINWLDTMQKLRSSKYAGAISLEVISDSYADFTPFQFLQLAYNRAEKLSQI
jgi:sugar phosphate isomerase/epimerase